MMKRIVLILFVVSSFAQTVETSIKLTELETLKGRNIIKDIEILDLKMRDLRVQLFTLESSQVEKISQLKDYNQFILSERFLNGREYVVDWDNAVIVKSQPTPREESNLPKVGEK